MCILQGRARNHAGASAGGSSNPQTISATAQQSSVPCEYRTLEHDGDGGSCVLKKRADGTYKGISHTPGCPKGTPKHRLDNDKQQALYPPTPPPQIVPGKESVAVRYCLNLVRAAGWRKIDAAIMVWLVCLDLTILAFDVVCFTRNV